MGTRRFPLVIATLVAAIALSLTGCGGDDAPATTPDAAAPAVSGAPRHIIYLSEFNILLAVDGPVIIDLPQAIDAAGNNHAARMLLRDVANLRDFFGRFAPYLERDCLRSFTPCKSNEPRTMW